MGAFLSRHYGEHPKYDALPDCEEMAVFYPESQCCGVNGERISDKLKDIPSATDISAPSRIEVERGRGTLSAIVDKPYSKPTVVHSTAVSSEGEEMCWKWPIARETFPNTYFAERQWGQFGVACASSYEKAYTEDVACGRERRPTLLLTDGQRKDGISRETKLKRCTSSMW